MVPSACSCRWKPCRLYSLVTIPFSWGSVEAEGGEGGGRRVKTSGGRHAPSHCPSRERYAALMSVRCWEQFCEKKSDTATDSSVSFCGNEAAAGGRNQSSTFRRVEGLLQWSCCTQRDAGHACCSNFTPAALLLCSARFTNT